MKRRALLSIASVVCSGGCLALNIDPQTSSQRIKNHTFTIYEPESEGFERMPGPTEHPVVSFDLDSLKITVRGALYVGSSECNQVSLKDISYDVDAERLTVSVGSSDTARSQNNCSLDESVDAYRLVVTMRERLPKSVTVNQSGDPSAKSVTVSGPNEP